MLATVPPSLRLTLADARNVMSTENTVSIAIIYHSGMGHTRRLAEAVAAGAGSVPNATAHLIRVEDVDAAWSVLASADAIIFGSPTYMGSASAPFKAFMDACSSRVFRVNAWNGKFAAGFTNGSSRSGDKLNTLVQFVIFAAQLGMNWISLGLPPANDSSEGSEDELNRHSFFLGAAAQSNRDQASDVVPPVADLRTAEHLGRQVASTVARIRPVRCEGLSSGIGSLPAGAIPIALAPPIVSPSAPDPALVAEIVATAALPLSQSRTLPREAYVDDSYFRQEAQAVLRSGWMCVAHVSQLPAPGAYRAVDLLGEPMVVVRDEANTVRVLSRVCPHRGTDILHECFNTPREGQAKRLVCPYHAWSFSFDGKLNASPEMHKAEGFNRADWKLGEFRSEVWEGFVFVNMEGNAQPLAEQYEDFRQVIQPWNTADMEVVIELEWECEFNWKVMVENWMESYHHMGIHHDTLQRTMPARTTWTEPEHPHFIRCHLPFKPEFAARIEADRNGGERLPGFSTIEGLTLEQESEWGLFLGHPCFMFLTMRDRVLWYCVEPLSAGLCKLKTLTLVPRGSKSHPYFAAAIESETKMLSDFHSQDMQVSTAVQRGLASGSAVRGRLSHLEEPVWLIQRYLAARLQGRYPLPAEAVTTVSGEVTQ